MDKRAHVAAADALLKSGNDTSLRYAALELRMAMESIAAHFGEADHAVRSKLITRFGGS